MSGKLILQHQDQHTAEKKETTITLVPEIDQEIECPRCHETMALSSDFDKLCYCCEVCNFSLKIG
jgi:hypothetical protein